jgi:hypothetical protein
LKVSSNDDIPKHGAMDSIAGGATEPHHPLAPPKADDNGAACQHPFEICCVALLCPKSMFVQQAAQLEQAAAWLEIRAQSKPAQAWGAGSMFHQLDPGHSSADCSSSSAFGFAAGPC